jgi:hypothetical protein
MEREGTSPWLGFRLADGKGALGLNSSELPPGSGRRRCHDDDQLIERNSMEMTTGSIVSRRRR